MKLLLTKETLVREIKAAFRKGFPYLKLEFFAPPQPGKYGEPFSLKIPDHFALGDFTPPMQEGDIELTIDDKISEVEEAFRKRSFYVQVSRKTLFSWIGTQKTRNLTLEAQNKKGRVASEALYDYEVLL